MQPSQAPSHCKHDIAEYLHAHHVLACLNQLSETRRTKRTDCPILPSTRHQSELRDKEISYGRELLKICNIGAKCRVGQKQHFVQICIALRDEQRIMKGAISVVQDEDADDGPMERGTSLAMRVSGQIRGRNQEQSMLRSIRDASSLQQDSLSAHL